VCMCVCVIFHTACARAIWNGSKIQSDAVVSKQWKFAQKSSYNRHHRRRRRLLRPSEWGPPEMELWQLERVTIEWEGWKDKQWRGEWERENEWVSESDSENSGREICFFCPAAPRLYTYSRRHCVLNDTHTSKNVRNNSLSPFNEIVYAKYNR